MLEVINPAAGGADTNTFSECIFNFMPASLHAVESNFPPLEKLDGTTTDILVLAYDDTTEEYRNGHFIVPNDVDTSGTVTFHAYVMAKTAAASRNIGLTFGWRAINDSEDFDGAYTDEDSGATAIDATQDDLTEVTWTETMGTLGWVAGELIIFRLSRDPGVASDLVGDMYLLGFAVRIPRTP